MPVCTSEKEGIQARLYGLECKDTFDKGDWAEWYALRDILRKMADAPATTRVFAIR